MNTAKNLFLCIGDIGDALLEEAELFDIVTESAKRRRIAKYGAVAAAASVGIAAAVWFFKQKRVAVAKSA
jgi:hypothetical protein